MIRAQFGDAVADTVLACTDGTAEGKAVHTDSDAKRRDWVARKHAYLIHLASAPDDVALVSACDKLHNARAIVQDLQDERIGRRVFERFTGGDKGTLGYYQSLTEEFLSRALAPAKVLDRVVSRMHELAGASSRIRPV